MSFELCTGTGGACVVEVLDSSETGDDETVDTSTSSVSALVTRVTALESALAELESRVAALEGGE